MAPAAGGGYCIIHSLPSFVDQGEGSTASSVADIIELECTSEYAEKTVKVTSQELYARCNGHLVWAKIGATGEWEINTTPSIGIGQVRLDDSANATVVVWGGPECASGESLITAHLEESPPESFTTSFTVRPPKALPAGVTALDVPANGSEVEDGTWSDAATIVQMSFPNRYAEKQAVLNAESLYYDCPLGSHLLALGPDGIAVTGGPGTEGVFRLPEFSPLTLNNNGNAFLVLLAGRSCTAAKLAFEASVDAAPGFLSYTTDFTILPPQNTWEEPNLTLQKLQHIKGSSGAFTPLPLTGALGQTVEYQLIAKNTGNIPLTFRDLLDPKCDPGTIAGGPGFAPVEPGDSTTYTCSHLLTAVGTYTNVGSVTGATPNGDAITRKSNEVIVDVPAEPAFTIEKLQEIHGTSPGFTKSELTGEAAQVVDYEILLSNTGNVPLTFGSITDPNCEGIEGGRVGAVAPGESVMYTCLYVLGVGTHDNKATATGTPPGGEGSPVTHDSNTVVVVVPAKVEEHKPPEEPKKGPEESKTPPATPSGSATPSVTKASVPPQPHGGVLSACEQSQPGSVLHGASGPKRGTFTAGIALTGIRKITFYLDGRRIKTLGGHGAMSGNFKVTINTSGLSYAAHKLWLKAYASNPDCPAIARGSVFVHPHSASVKPRFTG